MKNTSADPISLQPDAASSGADRTLAILELLGRHPHGQSASNLARELDLPLNSAMRIMETMVQRGWLDRGEDRRFFLTNRVGDLTRPQINDKSLVVCAWEALKQLRDESGETAQLVTFVDQKILVLEQCESNQTIKVAGQIGARVPAYSCAPGKAILAALPEHDLDTYLDEVKLKQFTPTTRSTRKQLVADLLETRERGFATDEAEGLEGIRCAAAVISDQYHFPVAALTVIGPAFRMKSKHLPELGDLCCAAAASAEEQLLFGAPKG
ncbi:MAG: IclR family transcriptional regulator [Verrucomicrobiota bacterium]